MWRSVPLMMLRRKRVLGLNLLAGLVLTREEVCQRVGGGERVRRVFAHLDEEEDEDV